MESIAKKTRIGKRYRKVFFLAAAVLFLSIPALFLGLQKLRNQGVTVLPDKDYPIGEVVVYGQKDALWAKETLGQSRYTMGSSGCLVCCIAASLEMQGREKQNPGSLNHELSRISGYDKEGNLQWDALSALDGRISVERCKTVDGRALQNSLEAGRFPIVRVRLHGTGSVHYVLIVGAKDGEYWCVDPLKASEETVPLSYFGNRVYAVRYTDFHSGTEAERSP